MVEPSERIVIGLSGGADSVCLLLVLCSLAEHLGTCTGNLFAVHVNHMIRGAEADSDEQFAGQLCDRLGVHFFSFHKDIPAYALTEGLTVEEAGRTFRYECFNKIATDYECGRIAVAHNKNDLAETVIFNLLRGSGLKGISGMEPVRGKIIRPLLDTTRSEIEAYLLAEGQDYRQDSTNAMLDYDRNRIRHIILPAMQEINSGAVEHICRMAEEAGNSYSFIHKKVMERYDKVVSNYEDHRSVELYISEIFTLSPVLQQHMIYEAIGAVAGKKKDITSRHVMSVTALIYQETGKEVELPYGLYARRSYDKLIISDKKNVRDAYRIDIFGDGVYKIPEWGNLHISIVSRTPDLEISKKIYTKMADYDKIKDSLCIRTPMDGDYIVIDDAGNTKKLSRVFIDCKIDRVKRTCWPVLACGQEIIWVLGLRYSAACKIDEATTRIIYMECERKGEQNGGKN